MAPFYTHLLIAEHVWPALAGPWQPYYGHFCFGCLAPDVDKVSDHLVQRQTHFYDRSSDYEYMASHRSAAFIAQHADFVGTPFHDLSSMAQAFVLGYLCHLCVDEVSKHMWRMDTWLKFRGRGVMPIIAFSAVDEIALDQIKQMPMLSAALCDSPPPRIMPVVPYADLVWMHQGCCNFVRATRPAEQYLALIDMFDRPTPAQRQQILATFQKQIGLAREQAHHFHLDHLVQASVRWCQHRFDDFIAGRTVEPAYPDLNF